MDAKVNIIQSPPTRIRQSVRLKKKRIMVGGIKDII